jgi:prepilin-type N-terminal cleavage/methylation domain-containing protein
MFANPATLMRVKSANSRSALQGQSVRAFSLIELLMVISIIAVIISIVLPAMSNSRNQAGIVVCLTNIRSLGQATEVYWATQEDLRTVRWFWYEPEPGYTVEFLTPWIFGGSQAMKPDFPTADSSQYPAEIRPLNKYIDPDATGKKVIKVFEDPGDRANEAPFLVSSGTYESRSVPRSIEANGTSYSLNRAFMEGYKGGNGNYGPFEIDPYTRRIAKHLSGGDAFRFIMWVEVGMDAACRRARPTLPNPAGPLRYGWHKKFSNWSVGFADGHVQYGYYDTRLTAGGMNGTIWQPDFKPNSIK